MRDGGKKAAKTKEPPLFEAVPDPLVREAQNL
jgi:hypothetical protein